MKLRLMVIKMEVLQAGKRQSQDSLQVPTKKKGKINSILGTGSPSSSTSGTNTGTASVSD